MADFRTKQGDTRNALKATLHQNGKMVDLADCEVVFVMTRRGKEIINREVTIADAPNGKVRVVFEEKELKSTGLHKGTFRVEWSDGQRESFPNSGYIQILIER